MLLFCYCINIFLLPGRRRNLSSASTEHLLLDEIKPSLFVITFTSLSCSGGSTFSFGSRLRIFHHLPLWFSFQPTFYLYQSVLSERVIPVISDYNMVKQFYVYCFERRLYSFCDFYVMFARLLDPGRMIMCQYQSRGIHQ